jgi:hypothetical protein
MQTRLIIAICAAIGGLLLIGYHGRSLLSESRHVDELTFNVESGPVLTPPEGCESEQLFEIRNPSDTHGMKLELLNRSCGCLECVYSREAIPPRGLTEIKMRTRLTTSDGDKRLTARFATGLLQPDTCNLTWVEPTHVL